MADENKTNQTADREMNIYEKIQHIRAELVGLNLKKTGKNTYSNFTYYELGDFLPSLNKLMDKFGICTRFIIQPKKNEEVEKAVLEVFNSRKPEEKVVFYSETAEVSIGKKADGTGGADRIQNLGGKITYMRRYLMMIAFEIVESDQVDAKDQTKNTNAPENLSLNAEEIKKIKEAKDLESLAAICKDMKAKKGPKYQKSLITYYTARKGELE
jgi:hypothetical protein